MKCFWSFFIGISLFCSVVSSAQELETENTNAYRHQIEIGTDNDFFAFITDKDRDYTYGLNAVYRFAPKKENFFSRIFPQKKAFFHSIGARLEAYTPNYDFDTGVPTGERPFAGWVYGTFATHYIFKKAIVDFKVDLGIMGPAVGAGEIQNWFHRKVSGDTPLEGWDRQIPNQLGVNLKANYIRDFYTIGNFNFFGSAEASLGNIDTYIFPEMHVRYGKFNSLSETTSLKNTVLAPEDAVEFFVQASAGAHFIATDATLQGNIFSSRDDDRRLNDIQAASFQGRLGAYATLHQFAFASVYYFDTGLIKSIRTHSYVAITGSFRF